MMIEKSPIKQLHAIIEGRVQGVGFRAFVLQNATDLNLTGWVRNRWNGDVEIVAEGEREMLERLLSAVHLGPRSANVINVHVDWLEVSGNYSSFTARRTE